MFSAELFVPFLWLTSLCREEAERGFSVGECRSDFCAARPSSFSRGRLRRLCSSARQFHCWVWPCVHGLRVTFEKTHNSLRQVLTLSLATHSISAVSYWGSALRLRRAA